MIFLSLKCNSKRFINRKNMLINDSEHISMYVYKYNDYRQRNKISYLIRHFKISQCCPVFSSFYLKLYCSPSNLLYCVSSIFFQQLLLLLQLLNVFHQMYRPNTTVSVDFKYTFQNDFINYLI